MVPRQFTCLVSVAALMTASCAQDGSNQKEVLGTGIGAALGGLVGSQFGHGSGKIVATLAGVGIGGFLGNRIGAKLDELDRQKAQSATEQVLADPGTAPASWSNPNSGNSGTVKAGPVFYGSSSGARASAAPPAVLTPPPANLELVPPVWVAHTRDAVNLRAAPNGSAGILGHLKPNRNFQALGKVPGTPWLVVGLNGQPVGYVSTTVVQPVEAAAPAQIQPPPEPQSGQPTQQAQGGPDVPPAPGSWQGGNPPPAPQTQPGAPQPLTPQPSAPQPSAPQPRAPTNGGMVDPGAIDRDIGLAPTQQAQGSQACRKTVSTIKIKGQDQPQTSEVTFCQQPDGNWAPVTTPS